MKAPDNSADSSFSRIRRFRVAWDAEREEWYFSVQDVVTGPVRRESTDPEAVHQEDAPPAIRSCRPTGVQFATPVQMLAADGNVAGVARKALEAETGKPVVTAQNAESFSASTSRIL